MDIGGAPLSTPAGSCPSSATNSHHTSRLHSRTPPNPQAHGPAPESPQEPPPVQGQQEALYVASVRYPWAELLLLGPPQPWMDPGPATVALKSPGLDMGQRSYYFSLLLEGDVLKIGVPAGERGVLPIPPLSTGERRFPGSQRRCPALFPPGQVAHGRCLSVNVPPWRPRTVGLPPSWV